MSRERVIPGVFARVHPVHRTPAVGVVTLMAVQVVVPAVLIADGNARLDVIIWLLTISGFGLMLAYALVAAAAIRDARRHRERSPVGYLAGCIGVVVMGYVFYKNVHPAPEPPADRLVWVFAALIALPVAWYAGLSAFARSRLIR